MLRAAKTKSPREAEILDMGQRILQNLPPPTHICILSKLSRTSETFKFLKSQISVKFKNVVLGLISPPLSPDTDNPPAGQRLACAATSIFYFLCALFKEKLIQGDGMVGNPADRPRSLSHHHTMLLQAEKHRRGRGFQRRWQSWLLSAYSLFLPTSNVWLPASSLWLSTS